MWFVSFDTFFDTYTFSCNYFEGLPKQKHCHSKRREDFKVCSASKVLAERLASVIGAHPSWLRSMVYPAICESFVLAAQLSTRDLRPTPPQRIYLCRYNNMVSWQRRARALCELALTSAIFLVHQTSLSIRPNSSRGSSHFALACILLCVASLRG